MIDARKRIFGAACLLAALCAFSAPAHAQDDLLGPDKPLHFGATLLLAGVGYTLGASLDVDLPDRAARDLRFGLAFGLPLAAGFAKELFDAAQRGTWREFSRGDLAWDLLGTMTGVTLSWLIGEVLFTRAPRKPRGLARNVIFSWS